MCVADSSYRGGYPTIRSLATLYAGGEIFPTRVARPRASNVPCRGCRGGFEAGPDEFVSQSGSCRKSGLCRDAAVIFPAVRKLAHARVSWEGGGWVYG